MFLSLAGAQPFSLPQKIFQLLCKKSISVQIFHFIVKMYPVNQGVGTLAPS